ncbi:hypothetical protein, partial [Amycolatopsis magusensis]
MSSNMTAVQRAVLYTASGGFLTIVFGLLGTAAAQAAPDKGAPAKIASVDKSNKNKTAPANSDAGKKEVAPGKRAGVSRSGSGGGPRLGGSLKRESR